MPRYKDLTGIKYGNLVVEKLAYKKNGRRYWSCRCECGNEKEVMTNHLTSNLITHCGCKTNRNLVGRVFGQLEVLEKTKERSFNGSIKYLCKCSCGNNKAISGKELLYGSTISCGCYAKKKSKEQLRTNVAKMQVESTDLNRISQTRPQSNNNSGVRGVFYDNHNQRWVANLTIKGQRFKKTFSSKQKAIRQRKDWEEKYFKPILNKYENKTKGD